jgi:hypothetical protein
MADEFVRAADAIDGVRCVYYRDDDDGGARRLGVLPEDARALAPELVRASGVDYEGLTAVLVQAVKELKATVLDLACILEVPPCDSWPKPREK